MEKLGITFGTMGLIMNKSKNLKLVGVRFSSSKNSIHGIVISILKKSNKPMRVRDITNQVLKIKNINSKTPINSVTCSLQTSKYVVRVDRGLYKYKK
jgi:hypothetical protein